MTVTVTVAPRTPLMMKTPMTPGRHRAVDDSRWQRPFCRIRRKFQGRSRPRFVAPSSKNETDVVDEGRRPMSLQGWITLPATPRHRTSHAIAFPAGVRRLAKQVLFIGPLFWFMELLQNQVYFAAHKLLADGQGYGWGYHPGANGKPTAWYSPMSLPLWALTVAVFSLLDELWFNRVRMHFVWRVVIAGVVGFFGEAFAGYGCEHFLGRCLQIWPGSPFRYIAVSALPFWLFDYVVFHWLTLELRSADLQRLSGPPLR
jgi:hypothetical protein